MNRRFAQLKTLSWYEWRLLLVSMVILPLTALGLYLFGFKRTQIFMARFFPPGRSAELVGMNSLQEARVIARMVGVAARHGVYHVSCLKQSLVLWCLLARRGIVSEIRIGVQKGQENPLHAHAWVECGGHTLNDSEDVRQRFSAFGPC